MGKKTKRGNGEGSVYEEKINGKTVIAAAMKRSIFIDGEWRHKRIKKRGFKTKSDARIWLAENVNTLNEWENEQRGLVKAAMANDITFKEVMEKYLKYHVSTLSEKVRYQYGRYLEKCTDLYPLKWAEITALIFQEKINSVGETYDVRKKMKTVLTGMGTFAIKQGWSRENVAKVCVLPEEPITDKTIFDNNEIKTLWKFYNGEITLPFKTQRNGKYISDRAYKLTAAALLIMIYSGMRPTEMLQTKPENVDIENGKIYRSGIKTKKGKTGAIFITPSISELVQKHIVEERAYEGWNTVYLRFASASLLEKLGMPPHVPSACRTTTATLLAELSTGEEELKTIMRHTDTRVTRKYYDKSGDELAQKAINQLDESIDDDPQKKINRYRKMIRELEEKIAAEEEKMSKN